MNRISSALAVAVFFPTLVASQQRTGKPTLQVPAQASRVLDGRHTVEFEVRTGLTGLGGSSNDLLLILFSNRSADTPLVPVPLLGEDVLAEFAFSGRDAPPGRSLKFRRRVADLSFLEARFIQVVNHGSDGWAGETLSLSVDAKAVLKSVALYPRKGSQERGGIERFNGADWKERNFWEADLQRIRVDKY